MFKHLGTVQDLVITAVFLVWLGEYVVKAVGVFRLWYRAKKFRLSCFAPGPDWSVAGLPGADQHNCAKCGLETGNLLYFQTHNCENVMARDAERKS